MGGVGGWGSLPEIPKELLGGRGRSTRALRSGMCNAAALRWLVVAEFLKSIEHGGVLWRGGASVLIPRVIRGVPGKQAECVPALMLSTSG